MNTFVRPAHQYQWGRSTGTATALALGSSPVISATARSGVPVGVYSLSLTPPSGIGGCTATLTLRSKPCQQVAHTYQCGRSVGPSAPATTIGNPNDPRLSNLAPGDTIRTGDFDVVVISITGGGSGGWTGTGYTQIPYLGNSKIAVELKGAVVNDCYELVGGVVQSAYDPSWGGVTDADNGIKQVQETVRTLERVGKLNLAKSAIRQIMTSKLVEQLEMLKNVWKMTKLAKPV